MEPITQKTSWLDKDKLQIIREFFAWILAIYFIAQYKIAEKEKVVILQTQIEMYSKEKELNSKFLQITDKMLEYENNRNNYSTQSVFPNKNGDQSRTNN